MSAMLRHRGPDADGVYTDEMAALAHTRLSIIDLSGGAQPMTNEDGSIWITFNGEIFNYLELRKELVQKGHILATRCDTEVILHLYEEEGEDCVRRLNGQWSFAIWDKPRRKLFVSRDRMGVRPLFYAADAEKFVFASEIKAIFAHPGVSRELDFEALDEIFTFWCTIPPRTAFRGIHELPPGHSLVLQNGNVKIERYWQLDFDTARNENVAESEYADQLRELLIDATRIRLRSDVPVGAYLSGGLDSTVTTALIRNFTDTPLKTFSVTFEDPAYDETPYQRDAVEFLHTDHQDVHCRAEDIADVFPDVIWHTEKPIVRTAPAPLMLLAKLVRQSGYKVVITGEGSDEVLGGYDIYKETKIRRFWQTYPHSSLRPLLLRRLYPYMQNLQAQPEAYRRAFFHIGNGEPGPFFSHLPRWEMTAKTKSFFSPEVKASLESCAAYRRMEADLPPQFHNWGYFGKAQYLESAYLLPGYILSSQGDRMAMAHSVEGRFPFLDYRVVEFAARLSPSLKMKVLNEKYLLKRCAQNLIPRSILTRPKQPYRAPEGTCFFTGAPRDYVTDLLSPDRVRRSGIFDAAAVNKLVEKFRKHQATGTRENMALVATLSTQILVDRFIEHSPVPV
jgi:asparagine synthase (glutamine-hydrolysing)